MINQGEITPINPWREAGWGSRHSLAGLSRSICPASCNSLPSLKKNEEQKRQKARGVANKRISRGQQETHRGLKRWRGKVGDQFNSKHNFTWGFNIQLQLDPNLRIFSTQFNSAHRVAAAFVNRTHTQARKWLYTILLKVVKLLCFEVDQNLIKAKTKSTRSSWLATGSRHQKLFTFVFFSS